MTKNAPADTMQKMIAEWQIRDVIGGYARGVDRRDGKLIRECFHPGALTHFGDFDGNVDTFVPWVLSYVESYSCTIHFMGTSIVDWPDNQFSGHAVAETCAAVLHERDGNAPGPSRVSGIRHIDRFETRFASGGSEAVWRIAERTVVGDWLRTDPSKKHRRFAKGMLTGQAGGDDPILEFLSRAAASSGAC